MNRFSHGGDLGDITSSLPVVRQLGGGEYILSPHPHRGGGPREPMTQKRANFILPLLRAQPYITDARFEENPHGITHDFADIRLKTQKDDANESLASWHARHIGITDELDTSPWLTAEPHKNYVGKVVAARSLRYNNHDFPWEKVFLKHQRNIIFIGTRDEHHRVLTRARGMLPLVVCNDALHMAQIIAASSHGYYNQSFPLWVALGLGMNATVECWKPSPDVRILRPNVKFFFDRQESREFVKSL